MPDDFGELEQQVMARIEEERAVKPKAFDQQAYDAEADAYFEALDYGHEASTAGIQITPVKLTAEKRKALSVGKARIPASPSPDDRICLVDPVDGALKMYSRAEIRARVRPCALGGFDDANGYAGTFEQPLRREVEVKGTRVRSLTGVVGQALIAGALVIGGWAWLFFR